MSLIIDRLYLGNVSHSRNPHFVKDKQIKFILVAAKGLKQSFPNLAKYMQLYIADNPGTLIIKHFIESIQFIEESMKKDAVLVHCLGGKSRSATIKLSYWAALDLVKKRHPVAQPNEGFIKQLLLFEKVLQLYDYPKVPSYDRLNQIMISSDVVGQAQNRIYNLKPQEEDEEPIEQQQQFIQQQQ